MVLPLCERRHGRNPSAGGSIESGMGVGDREPVQGRDKQGRTMFCVMLAAIVVLMAMFLLLRPHGTESGVPAGNNRSQH